MEKTGHIDNLRETAKKLVARNSQTFLTCGMGIQQGPLWSVLWFKLEGHQLLDLLGIQLSWTRLCLPIIANMGPVASLLTPRFLNNSQQFLYYSPIIGDQGNRQMKTQWMRTHAQVTYLVSSRCCFLPCQPTLKSIIFKENTAIVRFYSTYSTKIILWLLSLTLFTTCFYVLIFY